MSFVDITDNELIYLFRNNNEDAKVYLFARYQKRIYGFIKSCSAKYYLKDLDYEDLFHDCFIVFLKCLDLFDEEYNFYNYVYISIEKKLYKLLKKEKINKNVLSLDYQNDDICMYDVISDENSLYIKSEIEDYVDKIDPVLKLIIEYRRKGYSGLEIASIMGMSKKKVYNKIEVIKNILKSQIEKYK